MTVSFSSKWIIAALCGLSDLMIPDGAMAKDLEKLIRVLTPAYMAQNFTAFCASENSHFLSELKAGQATVFAFAEEVKRKVTIDLPEKDAEEIRVTSANAAREIALYEFSLIGTNQPGAQTSSIIAWCDRSAKPFVLEIMSRHERNRLEIGTMLDAAKR